MTDIPAQEILREFPDVGVTCGHCGKPLTRHGYGYFVGCEHCPSTDVPEPEKDKV